MLMSALIKISTINYKWQLYQSRQQSTQTRRLKMMINHFCIQQWLHDFLYQRVVIALGLNPIMFRKLIKGQQPVQHPQPAKHHLNLLFNEYLKNPDRQYVIKIINNRILITTSPSQSQHPINSPSIHKRQLSHCLLNNPSKLQYEVISNNSPIRHKDNKQSNKTKQIKSIIKSPKPKQRRCEKKLQVHHEYSLQVNIFNNKTVDEAKNVNKDKLQDISYSFRPQPTGICVGVPAQNSNVLNLPATNNGSHQLKQLSICSDINDQNLARRESAKKQERKRDYQTIKNPYSEILPSLKASHQPPSVKSFISFDLSGDTHSHPRQSQNAEQPKQPKHSDVSIDIDISKLIRVSQEPQQREGLSPIQSLHQFDSVQPQETVNHQQNPYCKQTESKLIENWKIKTGNKPQEYNESIEYSFNFSVDHIVD